MSLPHEPDQRVIDPTHIYSLAELIDFAQMSNPSTRSAWAEAKAAAARIGEVRSAYLPRLSASVLGAYQTSRSRQRLASAEIGSDGDVFGGLGTLSVQWLLFDFGGRRAVVREAEQASVAADIGFNAAHQRIIERVSAAYYEDAAARAVERDSGLASNDATAILAAAQDRLAHGQTTVLEVARSRQAAAQSVFEQVRARNARSVTRVRLLAAIGASPFATLQVLEPPERAVPPRLAEEVESAVQDALGRRPDMLTAFSAIAAADARVDQARADFRPKIIASASAQYNRERVGVTSVPGLGSMDDTGNLTGSRRSATALVGASIPIYDGGLRRARLRSAQAEAEAARARLDDVRSAVVVEIATLAGELRSSLASEVAAQAMLVAARTNYEAALDAYRSGVGDLPGLLSAEQALADARSATSRTRADALSGAAKLAVSLGAPELP